MIRPWRVSDCGCSVDLTTTGQIAVPSRLNYCPLHAAAPEMLEALEAMLLNSELGEAESQRQGKPRMIEVNDMARAAIAKTKGG